jgi:hypothetical protein
MGTATWLASFQSCPTLEATLPSLLLIPYGEDIILSLTLLEAFEAGKIAVVLINLVFCPHTKFTAPQNRTMLAALQLLLQP